MSIIQKTLGRLTRNATGLDERLIEACSSHFKNEATFLGILILLLPFISSILVGMSLANTFKQTTLFFLVLPIAFCVLYCTERAIVSSLKPPSRLSTFLRVCLFGGFLGVHILTADLLFFDRDIRKLSAQQFEKSKLERIRTLLDKRSGLEAKIQGIQAQRNAERKEYAKLLDETRAEANGKGATQKIGVGPITTYNQQSAEQYHREVLLPNDTVYLQSIDQLDTRIGTLTQQLSNEESKQPDYASVGMLNRLHLLHQLVRKPENWMIGLFMICIALIIAVLDFVPLIYRRYMAFDEYTWHYEHQLADQKALQIARTDIARISRPERLQLEAELEALQQQLTIRRDEADSELGYVLSIFRTRLHYLDEVENEANTVDHRFQEERRRSAYQALEKAQEAIAISLNDEHPHPNHRFNIAS